MRRTIIETVVACLLEPLLATRVYFDSDHLEILKAYVVSVDILELQF